ncbi:hypothetical protein MKW92_028962 [Papaver armeniacum]|nr:hypothetical protein MKW92_028962 [Papaver armeniacum]
MAANNELDPIMGSSYFLQKFKLYETESNFYMVGRDKSRIVWRVLKIDRLEATELNIGEDATTYSQIEYTRSSYPQWILLRTSIFSYSYNVMRSLQKNLCDGETRKFLTRGIRNHLKNTLWTVALVFGFFKQARLSLSGRDFNFTLIARRSRHYAGTRYLKRGVNENGRVANDVETEQIVFEDVAEGSPIQISSVVQNRGSIPLFWSQETSLFADNSVHDYIPVSKKDQNYEATRLHFENLVKRYGNPIIILNLIKTHEKRPRESILRTEFANAIEFINKDLPEENRLRFLHWDLSRHSRSKATNVLEVLGRVAANALDLTDFFLCEVKQELGPDETVKSPPHETSDACDGSPVTHFDDNLESADSSETFTGEENGETQGNPLVKPLRCQKGVLRTNCIDCLDRTNVAQYAYGLVALGHQLHVTGFINVPKIDLDSRLADNVMRFYETMGDTLAHQYGGSAAHNKIFSERRGQWRAATQSQEFFRTLQRYYSNAYMDGEKQAAINVFLGNFQPQQGRPALWELDSNQHYNADSMSTYFKRSFSENLLSEKNSSSPSTAVKEKKLPGSPLLERTQGSNKRFSGSTPEISTCESEVSYNRSELIKSPLSGMSGEDISNPSPSDSGSSIKGRTQIGEDSSSKTVDEFSDRFADWVNCGETLCH